MIKPEQYKKEGNIAYITMEMIKGSHTKREIRNFYKWYGGQTGILCKNEVVGIYTWDYKRWLESGMPSNQGMDWD